MTVPSDAYLQAATKRGILKVGKSIVFRKMTVGTGANPKVNPCSTDSLVVNGAFSSGVSTISLRGAGLTGYLRSGDAFTIGATTYTVAADTAAASAGAIATVIFAPALAANAADGDAAPVVFIGDTTLVARVGSYRRGAKGDEVSTDLTVVIASIDLAVVPTVDDKLIIDGVKHGIMELNPAYGVSAIARYDMRARA